MAVDRGPTPDSELVGGGSLENGNNVPEILLEWHISGRRSGPLGTDTGFRVSFAGRNGRPESDPTGDTPDSELV